MADDLPSLLNLKNIEQDEESIIETPPRYGTPSGLISIPVEPAAAAQGSSSLKTTKTTKTTQTTKPTDTPPTSTPSSSTPPPTTLPSTLPPPTPYTHSPTLLRADNRPEPLNPLLRYQPPYWWPYRTNVKQRWIGRGILEVVSTEFRDRSVDYYRHALESGVTTVNGKVATPDYILKASDRIENTVHRHEPPISISPILLLHYDPSPTKQFLVISKPGGMPVHATGRYFRNTILEVLKSDFGIVAYSVNRLDRLTSGLMILALTGKSSNHLAQEFLDGKVKKEYIARVRGEFPTEEIIVDKPLLTIDRQMGLVICHPDGKEAKTVFKRMFFDKERNESVVHCRPLTGRTHQLRVHLQYLGYPISNDPLYGTSAIWGPSLGSGGIDLTPSSSINDSEDHSQSLESIEARLRGEESLPSGVAPKKYKTERELEKLRSQMRETLKIRDAEEGMGGKLLPREDEDDTVVGGSPIYLSDQARQIIAKLRKQKDEQEDWVKWNQVIYRAKQSRQDPEDNSDPETIPPGEPVIVPPGFCSECHIPLSPDPNPQDLFIYLHAWRYTTENLGEWSTPLPKWAEETWDGTVLST